jgi:hypothetical protein
MNCYLIRGLPNSGKSRLAQTLSPNCNISADQWFENLALLRNSTYRDVFGMEQLGHAHAWCKAQFRAALDRGEPAIAVHNTFVTRSPLNWYRSRAIEAGYTVTTLVVERTHQNQNDHLVDNKTIEQMIEQWQPADNRRYVVK